MVTLLLMALGAVLVAAFVLAPLFRREEDLKSIRRQRPGTRHLHGLESVDVEVPDVEQRHCLHCGSPVDEEYVFCGECCKPVP
jgi:hypothetical protein